MAAGERSTKSKLFEVMGGVVERLPVNACALLRSHFGMEMRRLVSTIGNSLCFVSQLLNSMMLETLTIAAHRESIHGHHDRFDHTPRSRDYLKFD
jgi:hypothetical protein